MAPAAAHLWHAEHTIALPVSHDKQIAPILPLKSIDFQGKGKLFYPNLMNNAEQHKDAIYRILRDARDQKVKIKFINKFTVECILKEFNAPLEFINVQQLQTPMGMIQDAQLRIEDIDSIFISK
jgi:hypothetical protein